MSIQSYVLINTDIIPNVCDNLIMWDGDTNIWNPPQDHIALLQISTPSKNWDWDTNTNAWILTDTIGQGGIGYTWDGTSLITNEAQPSDPLPLRPGPSSANTNVENF